MYRPRIPILLIFLVLHISQLLFATDTYAQHTPSHINNVVTAREAIVAKISGFLSTIDVPVEEYITNALHEAEKRGVPLILCIDTYGGYLDPTLRIAKTILKAKVPVIGFINDKALSAGSIISIATHVLAITPYGVIGAAQPVMVNPVTGQIQFVNKSKILNPILAIVEEIAETRHRNTTAAKLFITKNLVLTGKEAVQYGIADLVATSLDDLIEKLHGWKVVISNTTWILEIARYEVFEPSIRELVYAVLRDPVINSILMFLGMFGTFLALISARFEVIPVTLVLLLLALIGSGMNVNIVAVLLLILGCIMLGVELFVTPGFGILGISGIIALIFGLMLMPIRPGAPTFATYVESVRNVAITIGIGLGAFMGFIAFKMITAIRRRPSIAYTPSERRTGRAVDRIEPGKPGFVIVDGEYWKAVSDEIIDPGEEVEIIGREGLLLRVRKKR